MDVDKLQQAFINIIKNAMESISGDGSVDIAMQRQGSEQVVVRISDTGMGLAPGEIGKIFDPDYTTKEKGLGLGLPIAHEIIRGHGGTIRVQSIPGQGTTFEISLPAKPAQGGTSAR
jgi:signal transduction histidine kinase